MTPHRAVVGYLSLHLLLRGDAVITGLPERGRHSTVTTIPGRTLQGMFAALCPPGDVVDLAVGGRHLTFGAALPAITDHEQQIMPATPAPLSWFRSRSTADTVWDDTQPVHDLLTDTADLPWAGRPKQIRGHLTDLTDTTTPVTVTSRSQLHQQRDRRRGRPVQHTGGPFEMITLDRGQVFTTRWRLSAATPTDLVALTDRVLSILRSGPASLGTAKDSRYGGALSIELLPAADPADADPRLERLPHGGPAPDPWPAGEHRDVLLLTPTLCLDPTTGIITPAAVAATVTAHYGPVDHVASWVAALPYSGYHALYRGYLPTETAAAAGTVIRLQARQDIDADTLLTRVTTPLGVRTTEGLGTHRLLPVHPPQQITLTAQGITTSDLVALTDVPTGQIRLGDGTTTTIPTMTLPVDADRPGLQEDTRQLHYLQHRLLLDAAHRRIDDLARSVTVPPKGPSRHLWARLTDLLGGGGDWQRGRTQLGLAVAGPGPDGHPAGTLTAPTQKLLSASWRPHRHHTSDAPGGGTSVLLFLRGGCSSDPTALHQWWTSNLSVDARRTLQDELTQVVLAGWRTSSGHRADPGDVAADWQHHQLPYLSWLLLTRWLTFGRRSTPTRTETGE